MNLEHGEIVGLMEPAILGLIGTSPISLRRAPDNLERSGLHTHNGPNRASLTCRDDGIVEPVNFSILLFLERQQENADDWLQEACDDRSGPLLNRIFFASTPPTRRDEPRSTEAKWAYVRSETEQQPFSTPTQVPESRRSFI